MKPAIIGLQAMAAAFNGFAAGFNLNTMMRPEPHSQWLGFLLAVSLMACILMSVCAGYTAYRAFQQQARKT